MVIDDYGSRIVLMVLRDEATETREMSLLTLAVSVPTLRPPSCGHGIKEADVTEGICFTEGHSMVRFSIIVFLVSTPFYRNKLPPVSLFTRMDQVIVASVRKWKVPVPGDPKQLHELSLDEYTGSGKFGIAYTSSLGFLDKAAVESGSRSLWMLFPVTQVEETKQMIKVLPVWAATFIPSTILAQVHTLFIKQGTVLDRSMGPHFEIPPACLAAFVTISMLISLAIYDRYFVLMARHYMKRPRGTTLLQRMGIGFMLHVIVMITACLAERKRLSVAREHNIISKNEVVPLSIFILLPQFVLMGVADNFVEAAKIEFFYDQAREGMKSLGNSYIATFLGIGSFLSSFLLSTVSKITKKHA
ncbi:protein NRT1/ PTR FAMILY 5.2 [Populus trichocarpa]|uniref:protein NRT1/ PTR FAMILY 5.2 n=1 Tax=Populus trichocarpa TaxID=3694 RepID=UPI0022782A4E|nr:protein NRT1/ PTR FAMILY 5.2 [Populus trichocarpa]